MELLWQNKDKALVSEGTTGYRWVDTPSSSISRSVHRILEKSTNDVSRNTVLVGDAGDALPLLTEENDVGTIDLVYIDPPFNTQKSFHSYGDRLSHDMWLSMLRDRVALVWPLLSDKGSLWVHLDDSEVHHARVMLDELLGENSFVSVVVWEKRTSRESRSTFSSAHDTILVYAPRGPKAWKETRNLIPRQTSDLKNRDSDPRGPWIDIPFTAPGYRSGQQYVIVTPSGKQLLPPVGRSWYATEPVFEQLLKDERIWFPSNGGGSPRMKRFAHELKGLVPKTIWFADEVGTTEIAKRRLIQRFDYDVPFDTPKPVELLERIVSIGTDPGDLVLDFFAGSGTTLEAAAKLGRNWIGIERSLETVERFLLPRLGAIARERLMESDSLELSDLYLVQPVYGPNYPKDSAQRVLSAINW